LVVAAGAVLLASKRPSRLSSKSEVKTAGDGIPLAAVERGDIDMDVHATGELRASHMVVLTAPSVGGGSLEITQLLATSSAVKKGDIVIEFDPGEQRYKLDQSRSELMQAQQEIAKANADAAVLAAQDKVAELKARYGVRQAELDVQKNEIVSSMAKRMNLRCNRRSGCRLNCNRTVNRTRNPVKPPSTWRPRSTTKPRWPWSRRNKISIRCGSPRPWTAWFRSRRTRRRTFTIRAWHCLTTTREMW
jgi:hypothetical protein